MIFELLRRTIKTIEYLCLGTIDLIVASWKFDAFKTSIAPRASIWS